MNKGFYKKKLKKSSHFNHKSPKVVRRFLYDTLALTPMAEHYTPTGKPGISRKAIKDLIEKYPNMRALRQIYRLKELDRSLRFIDYYLNPVTTHNHNNFRQMGAKTARVTAGRGKGIGIQQAPSDKIDGYSIRRAFIPSDKKLLLDFDFEGEELRLMAGLSKDKNMLNYFSNKESDLHSYITKKTFELNCPLTSVKKLYNDKRKLVKGIIFGITYGGTSHGLARQNNCELELVEKILDTFYKEFPSLKKYFKEKAELSVKLYIQNIVGLERRFKIPRFKTERKKRERVSKNFGVQSLGSVVLKIFLIEAHKLILDFNRTKKDIKDRAYILAPRHDELLLEIPGNTDDHKVIIDGIKNIAENILPDRLESLFQFRTASLPIEIKIGNSYSDTDLKKI